MEQQCDNCGSSIFNDDYTECEKCGAMLCPDCICEACENGYETTASSEGGY